MFPLRVDAPVTVKFVKLFTTPKVTAPVPALMVKPCCVCAPDTITLPLPPLPAGFIPCEPPPPPPVFDAPLIVLEPPPLPASPFQLPPLPPTAYVMDVPVMELETPTPPAPPADPEVGAFAPAPPAPPPPPEGKLAEVVFP